jgi:hypothetical protein
MKIWTRGGPACRDCLAHDPSVVIELIAEADVERAYICPGFPISLLRQKQCENGVLWLISTEHGGFP